MKRLFPDEIMDLVFNKKFENLTPEQKRFVNLYLSENEYLQLQLVQDHSRRNFYHEPNPNITLPSSFKSGIMQSFREHHNIRKNENQKVIRFVKPLLAAAAVILAGLFFMKNPEIKNNHIGPFPTIDSLADTIDLPSHRKPIPKTGDTLATTKGNVDHLYQVPTLSLNNRDVSHFSKKEIWINLKS